MAFKLATLALVALCLGSASAAGRSLHQANGLKNIAFLTTGGLFRKDASGNRVPINADSLVSSVPGLNTTINVASFKQIALIDSSEATPDFWLTVASSVQSALASADGVIIFHGTDTLQQTAWFLQCIRGIGDSAKPVILTGAFRGFDEQSPDGLGNMLAAGITAASVSGAGVLVVTGEQIYSAKYAQKYNVNLAPIIIGTSSGGGRVGQIVSGKVVPWAIPVGKNICPGYPLPSALPKVALDTAYPGSDGGVITYLSNNGAKGVVFSALGTGNIGASLANATLPLIANGFRAVVARGAVEGATNPEDGCIGCLGTTVKSGIVHAVSLDPFQARIILMLALAENPNISTADLQKQYNTISYN